MSSESLGYNFGQGEWIFKSSGSCRVFSIKPARLTQSEKAMFIRQAFLPAEMLNSSHAAKLWTRSCTHVPGVLRCSSVNSISNLTLPSLYPRLFSSPKLLLSIHKQNPDTPHHLLHFHSTLIRSPNLTATNTASQTQSQQQSNPD